MIDPGEPESITIGRGKVVTAGEAIRLIRNGDTVAVGGFLGIGFPEELTAELERRFTEYGAPVDLTAIFSVAQGDRRGRGLDHLCHAGLLRRAIGGHWGMSPTMARHAVEGAFEAWNLPQGVISHLFRDAAAGRPGLLTRVGLGTFADPRFGGGKVNDRTTEDLVEVMTVGGDEYLFYKALRPDVALLRGTTADPDGNVTMEREALTLDSLAIATAAHNAGGLVVVQVERIAEPGSLRARDVKIPGVLVDCVVVAPPERHWQTFGTPYAPAYSGELRVPLRWIEPLALSERKVIARRAAMELRPNSVINLGLGMPEGVASVANEEHVLDYFTLTADTGIIGGLPTMGLDFGAAVNARATIDQPAQFDFYDGGGLDVAVLGMAEVDRLGNVNVSRFGSRLAGAGAFINISQNAKTALFLGTFAAPCRVEVSDGRLHIDDRDARAKFVANVQQRTFSGEHASSRGQTVLYVTERCVFRLSHDGVELVEIAPGVEVDRDVLARMDFEPIIRGTPATMDTRMFDAAPIGLKDHLLSVPLEARFSYDPQTNRFFINLEGVSLTTQAELDELRAEVDSRLADVGKKVYVIVNYDSFYLAPDLFDAYTDAVRSLADRYYLGVTRHTTSSFLRLKLGDMLGARGVAPHIYESREEAAGRLGRTPA